MATLYRIGDALLDPGLARIERAGTAVELQPKPLAVLLHLIAHRDRVVTRAELLRAVWPGVAVGESSLTRAVSLLRTALGERAATGQLIATQSRRGYRLVTTRS